MTALESVALEIARRKAREEEGERKAALAMKALARTEQMFGPFGMRGRELSGEGRRA